MSLGEESGLTVDKDTKFDYDPNQKDNDTSNRQAPDPINDQKSRKWHDSVDQIDDPEIVNMEVKFNEAHYKAGHTHLSSQPNTSDDYLTTESGPKSK